MAPRRPYWKGYLKLSLVTCPVAMTPATSESEKVRFHTLNKDTGNRVVSQYVDSVTGKAVKDEHEAKGYERGENDYVILTDEDLESVELETVWSIDIEKFVPRGSIEWVYLETPFYLTANNKIGDEAFAVIRQAMEAEDVVGISLGRAGASRAGGTPPTAGRRQSSSGPSVSVMKCGQRVSISRASLKSRMQRACLPSKRSSKSA
jgi:DNA end-binding protein Ku